jgi:predicted TIM-barrel fold metal-dependent hydrolase
MKSILAYRYGFDLPLEKPSDAAVAAAADVYLRKALQRLTDPTLLSAVLWSGVQVSVERGLPIQLHAGYGDADIMLHRTNPAMLTEWLRAIQPLGVPVVFLHCYPYHREAGYLSAVFPDVYFDVGLAINYLGPSASQLMSESLELAPFSKQLYSSDAFGAAELYYLGARLFRSALSRILGAWVEDDVCSLDDAERIARQIGSENARRLYRLE